VRYLYAQIGAEEGQRTPPENASAVVIVDEDLRIIECNLNFLHLFSTDVEHPRNLRQCDSRRDTILHLFSRVLESGEDIVGHDIRYQRNILNTTVFTIEPHSVMCGIFQDITKPIFQKEQIIGRAARSFRRT